VVIGAAAYLIGHVAGWHPVDLGIYVMAAVFLVTDARGRWRSSRQLHRTRLGAQALPVTTPEVAALVERGRKIQAIKRYRELNPGIGLKEAKDVIDGLVGRVLSSGDTADPEGTP
jgi:ribosomal protein L7/L12